MNINNSSQEHLLPNRDIPSCLGPKEERQKPNFALPSGAWDTHFHLFDPVVAPYDEGRKYTPPPARLADYLSLMGDLGIERAMLVHANVQGQILKPLIDALIEADGRFVAVIPLPKLSQESDLGALAKIGVRGIRLAFNPMHGGVFDIARYRCAEELCARHGLFIELHFGAADIQGLAPIIAGSRVPIVIDHMGRVDPADGLHGANFHILSEIAAHEHVWVKLSGADRLTRRGPPYDDVVPLAQRLLEIAPGRMLWGTDWPHTGHFHAMPDDGALLNLLSRYAPEEDMRRRILVDNPLALIGE